MKDLVSIENINAVDLFNGSSNLDDLLFKIADEAKSLVPDLTTKMGRDEIASVAHKVARSKTYLDGLRKDLIADKKKEVKAVDAEGKKMRATLDALKAEVRQPLTDWEEKEDLRVDTHKLNLVSISEKENISWSDLTTLLIKEFIAEVEAVDIKSFEEFTATAAVAKEAALKSLNAALDSRVKYDSEQEELEKLRAESAAKKDEEEKEQLRLEGENRAKIEAEEKAKEEKERVKIQAEKAEKDKQQAILAKEQAEKRAQKAEENAKIEAEKAAQAERDRIEQERLNEEIAAKKREANKAHKKKINNAILDAFVICGVSKIEAKKAVEAIAKNEVPYLKINY
ncbi:MAG: hypothetical protein ACUZ8H_03850 [Candidatus Anammoxibacter sp.]